MAVRVDWMPMIGRRRGAKLIRLAAGVCGIMLLIFAGCAGSRLPASTPDTATPSAAAITQSTRPEATLHPEGTAFVDAPGGLLRVTGIENHPLREGGLALMLRELKDPPPPPPHWELRTPVFDITAQDEQKRPVTRLDEALVLHFRVAGDGLLTVLVHDGDAWQVVPSEIDADGSLSASVTHLTPYTVGSPAGAAGDAARNATPGTLAGTSSRATPGLPPATRTMGTRQTGGTLLAATRVAGVRSGDARPAGTRPAQAESAASVPVTVTPVSSAEAQAAVAEAAQVLKGHAVKVIAAQGYTGALYVVVPPALEGTLQSAMEIGGTGYYGLYNALNQALTLRGYGQNTSGSLTLLVEPKTTLPAGAVDAMTQLTALFPGIDIPLTQVQTGADTYDAYTFYGLDDHAAYATGYVSYEGLVLAYAMSGSGAYQALVPR